MTTHDDDTKPIILSTETEVTHLRLALEKAMERIRLLECGLDQAQAAHAAPWEFCLLNEEDDEEDHSYDILDVDGNHVLTVEPESAKENASQIVQLFNEACGYKLTAEGDWVPCTKET
jgi:hypothetical protein